MHREKLDNEKKCQYIPKTIVSTETSIRFLKSEFVLIKPSKIKKQQSHIFGLKPETFIILKVF